MQIIRKWEKRVLDADYLRVEEEGPECGQFAKYRKGHECGVARGKGGLGLGFFHSGKGGPNVDFSLTRIGP